MLILNLLNLLDKNSRIQISMVHFLLDYNAKTSTTTMIEELALTRFLFETNIEEVGSTLEQLNIGLSLTYDKIHNSITLQKDNHTSLDKFYYYYLNRSVDYQILIYLYQHPSYSIVDLSHSVSLSEAAIYRHLKKLNKEIEEFDIQIRKGTIIGDELQICYFFYQLFWVGVPLDELEGKTNDVSAMRFADYLEKKLKQTFTREAKLKLYLWIRILKTRILKQSLNDSSPILETFFDYQTEDSIYQIVRDAYFFSLSHSAVFGSPHNAIYLYLFISSMSIVPPDVAMILEDGYWPTSNPKIIALNELVVSKVKSDYQLDQEKIDETFIANWKYYLTQIHGSLLYFRGSITFLEEKIISERLLKATTFIPNFELANQIVDEGEILVEKALLDTTKQLVTRIYLYFINQIKRFSTNQITIGVHSSDDYLYSNIMVEMVKTEFENHFFITCEIAEFGKSYDILVTNSTISLCDFGYTDLYITNNFKTNKDVSSLRELLAKHSQKNKPLEE